MGAPPPAVTPPFLYGTAWKEDRTRALVRLALGAGFRGIDTANQRRHYHEAGVGEALAEALDAGVVSREELFLQTKFTYASGQDHRLPYDPGAPVSTQVRQSFESSLAHLGVDRIDSYVLHGPASRSGLKPMDLEAWRAMEEIHAEGGTRFLGVSNIAIDQLDQLCERAAVLPAFVQNRCFAELGWDRGIRDACHARGITYQGFSLLTANRGALRHPDVARIATGLGRTPAQVVFRFALQVGMLPLTGTTSAEHLGQDLACLDFELGDADMALVENIEART